MTDPDNPGDIDRLGQDRPVDLTDVPASDGSDGGDDIDYPVTGEDLPADE